MVTSLEYNEDVYFNCVLLNCFLQAIKLHAWEVCFGGRVTDRRDKELQVLSDVFLWKIPLLISTTVAPFMVSTAVVAVVHQSVVYAVYV